MARPTQAHLTKKLEKYWSEPLKQRTKDQMVYYMGAKLIEVGVDPKSAIYRWTVEDSGKAESWTYSAYWGDSKDKILQQEQDAPSS